ncbi:hypothetical protein ACN6MY_12000 [Peribacillus sp. B-H-3]|uniref:hypothetical protein n=1 Tax=Peribacillus sp. B-H-3 TaxID=3400420 RepID=UPI003B01F5E3
MKGTLSKRLILLYRRGKWLTLALADHFSDSRLAYLYHRYRTDSGLANKVIQVLYDGESRKEINVLLEIQVMSYTTAVELPLVLTDIYM